MNDFTKDELQIILDSVVLFNKTSCLNHEGSFYKKEKECIKKIQSMIDNYCEHEEKETVVSIADGLFYKNRCKKCGRDC